LGAERVPLRCAIHCAKPGAISALLRTQSERGATALVPVREPEASEEGDSPACLREELEGLSCIVDVGAARRSNLVGRRPLRLQS
jgi:hypothetical protein